MTWLAGSGRVAKGLRHARSLGKYRSSDCYHSSKRLVYGHKCRTSNDSTSSRLPSFAALCSLVSPVVVFITSSTVDGLDESDPYECSRA